MEIDLRHCFDCDRHLDDPPPDDDRRLRRCPDCQADIDAHMTALGDLETMPPPRFQGAIALRAPLPGWPTAITLLALEVWDRFSELSYVEIPGPKPPEPHPRAATTSLSLGDQPPRKWILTTDTGTVHHAGGGGGGTPGTDRLLAWERTIAPTLPPQVRRLDVRAQSPGATAHTTIDLSARPLTQQSAVIDHDDVLADADPACASCGPPLPATAAPDRQAGLELDWAIPAPPEHDPDTCHAPDPRHVCPTCRSNQKKVFAAKAPTSPEPNDVVAIGARLGPLFDAELVIPALIRWPTWFDLCIAGHHNGAWGDAFRRPTSALRWSAHDDRGRRYDGAYTGGGSGLGLARKDLSFTPALAPDAMALTVTFPAAIDGQAPTATFDLHPEPAATSR